MSRKEHAKPKKIVLLGPESSGKTTLAQTLAAKLDAYVVPEYFRFYWDAKRHTKNSAVWSEDEFIHMAMEQNRFEDLYAVRSSHVLLCDTSAWQVAAWHGYYLGSPSEALIQIAQSRRYDLICLCRPDIPFVQDGVRDGAHSRDQVYQWLQSLLNAAGLSALEVSGDLEGRTTRILDALQLL